MKKQNSYPRKDSRKRDKKKKNDQDSKLNGFSTLNQVSGVPKPHSYHSRIPVAPVRTVTEPHDTCSICGKTIENISSAFLASDGTLVHFDCVLENLKKSHTVHEGQTISYIGRGNFALLEKDEKGSWTIVERYPVEDQEKYERMKAYVEEHKA